MFSLFGCVASSFYHIFLWYTTFFWEKTTRIKKVRSRKTTHEKCMSPIVATQLWQTTREGQNRECIFTEIKILLLQFVQLLSCVAHLFYHIFLWYTTFFWEKVKHKKHNRCHTSTFPSKLRDLVCTFDVKSTKSAGDCDFPRTPSAKKSKTS